MVEEELRTADKDIDCSAFVNIDGHLHCSIENLEESVQNERSEFNPAHVYHY